MQKSPTEQSPARAEVREEGGGRVTVVLRGFLDAQTTAACWRVLEKQLRGRQVTSLDIDASQLALSGGIGMALLSYLEAGRMTPGAKTTLHGLKKELREVVELFPADELPSPRAEPSLPTRVVEEAGAAAKSFVGDLRDQTAFIGAVITALPLTLLRPKRMRWREVRTVMEKAGANALPVISLFSFLVGLVLALEADEPLRKFGAQIFIADMIGFSALRDTGPLVTAIMLAGRSGSAFAAELGTMKVNEELDALTTMGLDPIQFLVLQRIVAALLLTPLLTLYAMLMSILGGVLVMRFLGFPPLMIYHEIVARVKLTDFGVGLEKAAIFGLIIGGIGCLRGLQTDQGPSAVGVSTTRSVVASIILVILADTLFSLVEYLLKS